MRKPQYFKTWLIKIAINECYKINEKEKKHLNISDGNAENIVDNAINITGNLENESFFAILRQLPKKQRFVIYLHYGEEYKVKEIAQMLNISPNTVKTRLVRGREY